MRRYTHGHHEALTIRPRDYASELSQVQDLLEHNRDHEGIREAISYLDHLLKSFDRRIPCYQHVANLYDQGLRGEEVLQHVSALYVLHRNPHSSIIKSDEHFKYAVGATVLKLRSQHGMKIKPIDKKSLGEFLIRTIGTMCVTICYAIEQHEAKQRDRYVKFTKPLTI